MLLKERQGTAKTYFVINDYAKLRQLFGELLKRNAENNFRRGL